MLFVRIIWFVSITGLAREFATRRLPIFDKDSIISSTIENEKYGVFDSEMLTGSPERRLKDK
jgi:hypothetical protein